MALLMETLVRRPFGIPAFRTLLPRVPSPDKIYKRDEIIGRLQSEFSEQGGRQTTTAQVAAPLKKVLKSDQFERMEHGFYRYLGPPRSDDASRPHIGENEPTQPKQAVQNGQMPSLETGCQAPKRRQSGPERNDLCSTGRSQPHRMAR